MDYEQHCRPDLIHACKYLLGILPDASAKIRAQLSADKDVLAEEAVVSAQVSKPAGGIRCPEYGDSHEQKLVEVRGHHYLIVIE